VELVGETGLAGLTALNTPAMIDLSATGSCSKLFRAGSPLWRCSKYSAKVMNCSIAISITRTQILGLLLFLLSTSTCSAQWTLQESGTKARLRGLSVISSQIAWASGADGTCLRTVNGGKIWVRKIVPGASSLDFRDIYGANADIAYLLSIGEGERSRIYKTTDGGATWALQHTNQDPKGFLDAIAFWDAEHGLALGDPVDGRFMIFMTDDGGKEWKRIPVEEMPLALHGEGAFAASGTCLVTQGDRNAWLATGGVNVSRVFRSTDRGKTWTVHETPIRAGTPSSGVFSLAFWDGNHGVAVGGDYKEPEKSGGYIALTSDGGRSWALAKGTQPAGYRSGVAIVPSTPGPTLVAVGPTGTEISVVGGENWKRLGTGGVVAVGFAGPDVGWAAGEDGRIARFGGVVPGDR
jgi:photosystem II stability/assembly factor-like uncharacterized protein